MKTLRKKKGGRYEAKIRIPGCRKTIYRSLGTKNKEVAQKRLDKLYREMELEAEGLAPNRKLKEAAATPLPKLIQQYIGSLEAGSRYINQMESRLKRIVEGCDWKTLHDVDAMSFKSWRVRQHHYTPKTKNHYQASMHSFCRWLVDHEMLERNPFEKLKPVPIGGDHAFKYRSLRNEELLRLINTSGKRSLIYRFCAYTGLRHAEMKALEWGDIQIPFVRIRACTAKNSKDADIKLHPEIIPFLEASKPKNAQPADKVFPFIPDNRTVKRDFKKAGIETDSARGEKASFHSLRKTFCNLLHAAGVPHRLAQDAMRHSTAKLTNDVYYDKNAAALADAIDSLPSLAAPPIAPPKSGSEGQMLAQTGIMAEIADQKENAKT